ncbi:peptidylprolyl isomerase [Stackebrandtia nassauensis]|uniref:Peptidyl-prolyl cis-trans isomerase (Rotamase)-cyclophilin family-like protein n=1 Tax=Stackebrandtia nassauensis (strain DSM 44728 / CIP 108903 / NRRL B-16338 / NBRC 102104 / LLR-40K-21) TaxID=446470 RepID=D3PZ42_STANL|nr:peptidylprolyl isomerase [Stackebrandtia nassauensis]ADD45471.1 Peptidyl-prolyl cis-trans isomerase (rotamase) - cyclophilin family-like protein [Stackebrandtia nassauensis DSM 44728]
MDAKSDDDVTEPNPSADDVTEIRPAVQAPDPTPDTDRKAARKEARRQPLNPDDPEPTWLARGSGGRTIVGIVLVLVMVAGIAALGWWLFEPASAESTDDGKLTSEDCRVSEAKDEAATVRLPPSLGKTEPRATATVTTNVGELTVLLFGDVSPCGVSGFEYLTRQGFYANSPCYRLTTQQTDPTVTLRCGDPTGTGKGGPGFRYQAEDAFTGEVGRDYVALINDRKGMAGGSFAFVRGESKPTAALSVIGQVISGHGVLDQIGAAAGVDPYDDEPAQPVVIQKITIKTGTVTLPPSDNGSSPSSSGVPTTSGTGTATPSGSGQPSSGGSSSSGGGIDFPN